VLNARLMLLDEGHLPGYYFVDSLISEKGVVG